MAHGITSQDVFGYVENKAWHGLGIELPAGITASDAAQALGLNWNPARADAFCEYNGVKTPIGSAIVRDDTGALLTPRVSDDWQACPNTVLLDIADTFIASGNPLDCLFTTQEGRRVCATLKANKTRDIGDKKLNDSVQLHIMLLLQHIYGQGQKFIASPVRTVCNNTIQLAQASADKAFSISMHHRQSFTVESVSAIIAENVSAFDYFCDSANFLSTVRFNDESLNEYFGKVFPLTEKNQRGKDVSRIHKLALQNLSTQPGAELSEGSWWQALNTVTYLTDHVTTRETTQRDSSLFGAGSNRKSKALALAMDFANAA